VNGHQPRRRFGQNFLHDPGVVERIVRAMAPGADQHWVEIGPGLGALTARLAPACARLDAIEIDRDLVAMLRQRFAGDSGVCIRAGDALATDFLALADGGRLRGAGNLPYNISSALLFHLLAQREAFVDLHLMLQREVAQRLAAGPGSRRYGRLSVSAQLHCEVESLFDVAPSAFRPQPRVHSSLVRLTLKPRPDWSTPDQRQFDTVVRAAFGQRRKTLRNALSGLLGEQQIEATGIDPAARAETLSVADYMALARSLEQRP